MAEITPGNSSKQKTGVKKMIKKTTRVDLTPMVDLGFLLVTFFVFTTTMAQPAAMNMMVPNDKDSSSTQNICATCALTVILGGNDKLLYYEGRDEDAVYKATNYSATGIRDIIIKKKKAVLQALGDDKMMLIIKPSEKSTMKNMVNMIDESAISRIKRYYMADLNPIKQHCN